MNNEVRRIMVAGSAVELTVAGSGPALLYLHPGDGLAGSAALLEALSRRFTIYAPALAGFDGSELPRQFSTVDDLAYQVLDLADQLDLGAAMLAGVSFGGWVAAEVAIKSTERFSRLALVSPLGAKFDGPAERQLADIFYPTIREVRGLYFSDGKPDETDYGNHSDAEVERIVRNREALTLFGWSPHLHDPKLRQRLHRIRRPSLLLWGTEDRVAPLTYGRAFAETIPGAIFETAAGAGHYVHAEKPDWVADRIIAFAGAA